MRLGIFARVFILLSLLTSLGGPGTTPIPSASAQISSFPKLTTGVVDQDSLLGTKAPTLQPIDNADGDGNYLVTWTTVPPATSYTLQEDDNSAFTSPTTRFYGLNTQFQVDGQSYGTWYYRVMATGSGGNSPWSNTVSVSVIYAPPGASVLDPISNPDGNGEYLTNWSDVPGASTYRLEEADNAGFITPTVRYEGGLTEFLITGQEGGTWYYRVVATNTYGDGPSSNINQWELSHPHRYSCRSKTPMQMVITWSTGITSSGLQATALKKQTSLSSSPQRSGMKGLSASSR